MLEDANKLSIFSDILQWSFWNWYNLLLNFSSCGIKFPEYPNGSLMPLTVENAVGFAQLLPCQCDSYISYNISHLTK